MTFYERYAKLCEERGIKPAAQSTADMIGCTKSNISMWKNKGTTPSGDIILRIANAFDVSADYLLGRETTSKPQVYHALKAAIKTIPQNHTTRVHSANHTDGVVLVQSTRSKNSMDDRGHMTATMHRPLTPGGLLVSAEEVPHVSVSGTYGIGKKDIKRTERSEIEKLSSRLDAADRAKVEGFIQGILASDKYKN